MDLTGVLQKDAKLTTKEIEVASVLPQKTMVLANTVAVGFMPFVTWLEQRDVSRSSKDQITDMEWDTMVYKIMKVAFFYYCFLTQKPKTILK